MKLEKDAHNICENAPFFCLSASNPLQDGKPKDMKESMKRNPQAFKAMRLLPADNIPMSVNLRL